MENKELTLNQVLEFLVMTSPFAKYLEGEKVQELASRYYSWKAKRLYKKYKFQVEVGKELGRK